jgi:exodeoxyribonuclease V gamma subunit
MLPMRSIPFKVICLIGMNNTAFPRQARHLSFDMMLKKPRPGDRSARNTDRYIFLEAILSAREKLYISYIGQSITDNNQIPPSVVVSELLDYINSGFTHESGACSELITIRHKLQAFNRAYFDRNSVLSSFSEENFNAAKSRDEVIDNARPFFMKPLPELEDENKTIDMESLCRFFTNPAKYLFNNRLGIFYERLGAGLDDDEPHSLSGLAKYKLGHDLLNDLLHDQNTKRRFQYARADGILPHGELGRILFDNLAAKIIPLASKVKSLTEQEAISSLNIDLSPGGIRVTGKLENIYQSGMIHYKAFKLKEKDQLSAWIKFLLMCETNNEGCPEKAYLIGTDCTYIFAKPENPERILNSLCHLYKSGMSIPLPFFPITSYKYASSILKNNSVEKSLQSAIKAWNSSDYNLGESDDEYFSHCFDISTLYSQEFREIAEAIYMPMLNCMNKQS